MALSITKAYANLSALLEAHLDNFRNGLLTFFNTDKLTSANFDAGMTFTSARFASQELTTTDNSYLVFGTDDDGKVGLDASKNLIFDTLGASNTLTFKAASETMVFKAAQVDVPGEVIIGAGGAGRGILFLAGKYRKPVLQYSSSTVITLENNTGTTNETVIAFPSYVIGVTEAISGSAKYRRAVITATANGYDPTHIGAAQGGVRSGLTLSNNQWYTVYACRVRGGTDAGNKFILVVDQLAPTQGNYATLNSRYGDGQWIYLGLIRYGYGAEGSASALVPFVYTNKGQCYFTSNSSGSAYAGVTLAKASTDANDSPFHTLADGYGNAQVPCDVVVRGVFNLERDRVSNWAARDSGDVIIWRGGWQEYVTTEKHGHLVDLPVSNGIDFTQTRISNGAVDKRVVLMGFTDAFINVRRHGHGV